VFRTGRLAPALALSLSWAVAVAETPAPTPEELIARERVRSGVEAALEQYLQPVPDGGSRVENAIRAAESVLPFGEDAVLYLASELEQERMGTFDFSAYALGMLGTPGARDALRQAALRADEGVGSAAVSRKAWACWALGLAGDPTALTLLDEGKHEAMHFPMHGNVTALEAAALLTVPESIPLLLEFLDRYREDLDDWQERRSVLRSLRRIGDPATIPALIPFLEAPDPLTRRAASNALGAMPRQKATKTLLGVLADKDYDVRRAGALALDRMGAKIEVATLLSGLETETDILVRGAYYRLLVQNGRARAVELLRQFQGREDPLDRRYLVEALAPFDDPGSLEMLGAALRDEDNGVAGAAARVLGRRGGAGEVKALTEALAWTSYQRAQEIATELARLDARSAAPAIASSMMRALAAPITDVMMRFPMESMGKSLVTLAHVDALPLLREGISRQTDAVLAETLEQNAHQLETLGEIGNDVPRWKVLTTSEMPADRALAFARLGRIGSEEAAKVLVAAFETGGDDDRVSILRALGNFDSPLAERQIVDVLQDPDLDGYAGHLVRDMAAWSARRIGGKKMYEALVAAVERRDGREIKPFVYAVILGGKDTLPLMETYRFSRMRFLGWHRGEEQTCLDWIYRATADGRSIDRFDVPPRRMIVR